MGFRVEGLGWSVLDGCTSTKGLISRDEEKSLSKLPTHCGVSHFRALRTALSFDFFYLKLKGRRAGIRTLGCKTQGLFATILGAFMSSCVSGWVRVLGLRVAASLGFASDTYHARSGSSTPKPKAFNQALRFWYFADSGGTVCHPAFLFKCSEPSHLSIGGGFFTYLGCSAVSVVPKGLQTCHSGLGLGLWL